jgi:hypothetical protein
MVHNRQLTGGIANSNYFIISKDQSYYFCNIWDKITEKDTWTHLKALIALQSYGLPLAYPLKLQNNPNNRNNDDDVSIANYILHISSVEPSIVMYQ